MNARTSLDTQVALQPAPEPPSNEIDLVEYWDIIVDSRWLIAVVTALAIAVGVAYAYIARPVYEANLLIQVEDSAGSAKSFLGEAASLFDVKTAAGAEIEIIRSRMVIGRAVDSTLLYIEATPHYLPLIGNWLARRATELSNPGFLGFGGYVTGAEKIRVGAFDVPTVLEGTRFRVTAAGEGHYELSHPQLTTPLTGTVGSKLTRSTPNGTVSVLITALEAKPGAEFNLVRHSRLSTIEGLQSNLKLTEKGRQSGVIDATLQSAEPKKLTLILNEIGKQYVRQNIERKAAEAEKMLVFLDVQMPQFKKQLEQAEEAYNRYRKREGTVALDEEARLILTTTVNLHAKLLDAKQRRLELIARFTPDHPAVKTLDQQIAAWNSEIARLNSQVHSLPAVQQDALRLERDVKLNTEAYQSLRNNALQLQLIREGKVGNVRLIDEAAVPEAPIKPKRALVVLAASAAGLILGMILALTRSALSRGVKSAQQLEAQTGLSVYCTIPLSPQQGSLAQRALTRESGLHLLAAYSPTDPAIESLRSLRTALQFAMLEASNNRVLITGATPGVGKSFVSANLAAVLASAGKQVLLIDADLRKGHLNYHFGTDRNRGLSEVVAGTLNTSEAIRHSVLPNLDLLTTGVLPPNPAELMMSGALAVVLEKLSAQYDLVIMDTPPVLAAADTSSIAGLASTVLLVARAEQSQVGEIYESNKRLAQAGKPVSGVLFNAVDSSRRYYGSYGYKYHGYRYRLYSYEPRRSIGPAN